MVKTFLCHPFSDLKAFTDQCIPTAVCYTRGNNVLIASTLGSVQVHDLKKLNCAVVHQFITQGLPLKLLYSEYGNFLVSLESKLDDYRPEKPRSELGAQARVYFNFMEATKFHATLASGYTLALRAEEIPALFNQFVCVNLPRKGAIADVAVCAAKGNIAVAGKLDICIFGFKELMYDAQGFQGKLIDFSPLIEVKPAFEVSSVVLAFGFLAIASAVEVQVIQMYFSMPEDEKICQAEEVCASIENFSCPPEPGGNSQRRNSTLKQASHKIASGTSNVSFDSDFVVWNFGDKLPEADVTPHLEYLGRTDPFTASDQAISPIDIAVDKLQSAISLQSIADETTYIEMAAGSKEVLGPADRVVGRPVETHGVHSIAFSKSHSGSDFRYAVVPHVTLLYKRFQPEEMSITGVSSYLHSFQWLPVLVEGSVAAPVDVGACTWPWNAFLPPSWQFLCSHALFFSSGREGYLYEMVGTPKLIVKYSYTSDCHAAVHTNSVLCTLVDSRIEVYTSRLYANAACMCRDTIKIPQLEDLNPSKVNSGLVASLRDGGDSIGSDVRQRGNSELVFEEQYFSQHQEAEVHRNVNHFQATASAMGPDSTPERPAGLSANVHCFKDMLLPCPGSNTDVCLIGMFELQDSHDDICYCQPPFLGVTPEYGFALVRAKDSSRKAKLPASFWKVHVMKRTSFTNIYEELLSLLEGHEFSNPHAYYQLLCESHLLLRAEVDSSCEESVREDVRSAVVRSARRIGDFFARCGKGFDSKLIISYYQSAGLSFEGVLQRQMNFSSPEKKKFSFGQGMIEYVNHFLFGDADIFLQKEESDFILKIFLKNQPAMLSHVLLKSKLKQYSAEVGIRYMEKFKKKQESRSSKLSSFDHLCMAELYMRIGDPGHAEAILSELSVESLQTVCISNHDLLFTDSEFLTHLGQIVRRHFPAAFLGILVCLHDRSTLSLEKSLDYFKVIDGDGSVSYSDRACDFLEILLNDHSRKRKYQAYLGFLCEFYVRRLEKVLVSDAGRKKHQHLPKGTGHFAPRFSWLNKLAPFTGDVPSPQDCVSQRRSQRMGSSSAVPGSVSPLSSSPLASSSGSPREVDENVVCPCCCCSEVLLKFQSLLCSKHNRKDTSARVVSLLENSSFPGRDSLLLLTWPKTGKAQEALEYMVKKQPESILQYAKEVFDWKAQWEQLLRHLLHVLQSTDYEQWNQDTYLDSLRGVLLRLSRVYSPSEFLALLPANGSVQFFLPYMLECLEYCHSTKLRETLLQPHRNSSEGNEIL